jgi:hypothetical protein
MVESNCGGALIPGKAFKANYVLLARSKMDSKSKSYLAIVLGIIIILADLYWLADSYTVVHWLVAGIIIFVASVVWIWVDYDLMKSSR